MTFQFLAHRSSTAIFGPLWAEEGWTSRRYVSCSSHWIRLRWHKLQSAFLTSANFLFVLRFRRCGLLKIAPNVIGLQRSVHLVRSPNPTLVFRLAFFPLKTCWSVLLDSVAISPSLKEHLEQVLPHVICRNEIGNNAWIGSQEPTVPSNQTTRNNHRSSTL